MAGEIDSLEIRIAADSADAAESIASLAGSLESLGAALEKSSAISHLKSLTDSLKSLKNIDASGLSQAASDISNAFSQFNNLGTISNAPEILYSINDLSAAMERLDAVCKSAGKIRLGKNFSNTIETLSADLERVGSIATVSNVDGVGYTISRLESVTSGLRSISENINGLKVNKSFDTNLENLSLAITHLNDISDTSKFSGAIESVSQAINKLNNIEVGTGFFRIIEATTKWETAIDKLNYAHLNSEFSQGIARIVSAAETLNKVDFSGFNRMNDALSALPDNVRVSFGASSEEVMNLTKSLAELQGAVDNINSGVTSMAARRRRTPAQTTDNTTSSEVENVGYTAEESLTNVDAFRQTLIKAFSDAAPAVKTAAGTIVGAIDSVGTTLGKVGGSAVTSSIKTVFAPITALGKKFKEVSEKAGQFLSSIKRIAMYRAIRTALKMITEGFAEGRKNLYYYSQIAGTEFAKSMDKAATSALYLKNSIGAASAPLTNYLAPFIDRAVDSIVELINKFNELTATLTGASTWTKALKYPAQWQEDIEDSEKSAKKLKSTLLGFDELNVIEPADTGSKAKGYTAEDYSKMFEEVRTNRALQGGLPELLIPVKMAWDAEGDNTIQSIKRTWKEILGLLDAVRESFKTVWLNGTGQRTLDLILQTTQNIVDTFGNLAGGIRKAWRENEKGTKIIQSVWNAANNVLTVFRDIWGYIKEWAEDLDWGPLLASLGDFAAAIERLTAPDSGAMQILKALWHDVLLPLGKWAIEDALPASIEALTAVVETLKTAFDGLVTLYNESDIFKAMVDGLKAIGDVTFTNISGLVSSLEVLLDLINGAEPSDEAANTLEKSAEGIKKFFDFDKDGKSWYDGVAEKLGKIGEGAFDTLSGDYVAEDGTWKNGSFQGKKMGEAYGEYFADLRYGQASGDNIPESAKQSTSAAAFNLRHSIASDDIEQANFFKDFGSNFSGGMRQIGDAIKEAFAPVKELFASMIESAKDAWEFLKEIGGGIATFFAETIPNFFTKTIPETFDKAKKKVTDFVDKVKKSFSDGWTNVKTTFTSGWDNLKNGVENFKAAFKEKFDAIGNKVTEVWEGIKGKIGDALSWEKMKKTVTEFADNIVDSFVKLKENAADKIDEIKKKFSDFFGDLDIFKKAAKFRDDIVDFFKGIFGKDEMSGVRGVVNDIKRNIVSGFDTIKEKLKNTINGMIDSIEGLVNIAIGGINGLLDRLGDIQIPIIGAEMLRSKLGWDVPDVLTLSHGIRFDDIQLPRLATGGMVNEGQLFLANESGPEIVAQYGSKSAVMNNEQIVRAVSDGVYKAVSHAIQQNQSSGKQEMHIYLDRKELTSQIEQQQESNGFQTFSNVVYT